MSQVVKVMVAGLGIANAIAISGDSSSKAPSGDLLQGSGGAGAGDDDNVFDFFDKIDADG